MEETLVPVGAIRVTGGTGAITSVGPQLATVVRNGAGDYSLTLAANKICDATERFCFITCRDKHFAQYVETSDSVIQVLTFSDAGAAADADFTLILFRTFSR